MKAARVSVQFQSVIEKLSPHDTVFSFAQSADLRDSALSSACSLHTATSSIKSSNDSLPQKSLAEITEDVSESRVNAVESRLAYGDSTGGEEQSLSTEDTQIRPEKVNGFTSADRSHHRSTSATTQASFRPRTISNTDKPLPPPPPEDYTREDIKPGSILDHGDYTTRPSMDGRFSSNSTRPSTRDLYDAYGYKRKAKIGPRPSTDSVGAPNSSGTRTNESRPVSTLPAGLRMPSRRAVPARPASRQAQASPPIYSSSPVKPSPPTQASSLEKMTPKKAPTAPVDLIYIPNHDIPTPNNGLRTPSMPGLGSPKMTPEKQRLRKALQLRKEQIAAQTSVTGPGIKNESEEPEFTKPEIDDSILSAVIDASSSTEGLEPVLITTKDLTKEGSRLLEDSPISVPETAEEPSTQASSITDEEEAAAQKRQENHSTSIPSVLEHQDLSDDLGKKPHFHLTSNHKVGLEGAERDVLKEVAMIQNPPDVSQSSAPTQSVSYEAGKNVAVLKMAGEESPESEKYGNLTVTKGEVPNEEVLEDQQLVPSELLGSQAPEDQSLAGTRAPLVDRKSIPTAVFDEDRKAQRSQPPDAYEAASTEEAFRNGDLLQNQSLEDSEKLSYNVSPNDQARVLQSQFAEGYVQSPEHPVCEYDEPALREVPNNIVKSLLVRRSSSSKSITVPPDNINAHEVPLPPIDEDEEISLSPQRALFREQTDWRHPLHLDGESKPETLGVAIPSQISDHLVTGHSTSNGEGERQFRRQGAVNPIKRVSSPDHSEEQFLSDDSFMEELKCATLQEAKPVSVSKSPIKPVFSRSDSEQRVNGSAKGSRSVSTPVDHIAQDGEAFSSPRPPTPLSTSSRSFSAQHAPRPDSQQSHVPISKKIGVSSSISQRIKALEQLSNRPTSPVSPKLAPNTSTFLGFRTTSLRTPSGGSDYKNSNSSKSRPGTGYKSPSPSPETIRSSLPNQTITAGYSGPIKSATATVVRDAGENSPEIPSNPSKPRHLEHQGNPLQVEVPKSPPKEHKTMGPPPLSPLKPPRPRFGRYSSTRSGSSSSNEQKLEPPPSTRRDSFASNRSKSSRAGSEVELPRTLSDSSLSGVTSLDGTQDEKKDSRRSRLMKRMSTISSMSRRSLAHALSPSPKEAPIIERQEPIQEAPSISVDVGDVNVQFPDNLVKSIFNLMLTSANIFFSSGRGDTWSLMRKES